MALSRTRPTGISIRNIFAARILEIAPDRGSLVDIRLDIGPPHQQVALWARITLRSLQELDLAVGSEVFALLKTVALDRTSLGRYDSAAFGEDEAG